MMYTICMGTPQPWPAGAHLPRSTQRDARLYSPGASLSKDSMRFASNMSETLSVLHIDGMYTGLQLSVLHFHCLMYSFVL